MTDTEARELLLAERARVLSDRAALMREQPEIPAESDAQNTIEEGIDVAQQQSEDRLLEELRID